MSSHGDFKYEKSKVKENRIIKLEKSCSSNIQNNYSVTFFFLERQDRLSSKNKLIDKEVIFVVPRGNWEEGVMKVIKRYKRPVTR